jgi:PAS domain S-box-containing protein
MAAGQLSSDVIIGHRGEPGCARAGAGDRAAGRSHDEAWRIRGGPMRLRRIAPVWAVLALTAAGLLVALALMEREKPWLVLDTGLALAALTGAFAALSSRRRHAQREVDRIFTLSPDPIAIVGPDGYFVRVNPAFAQLVGHTAGELRSRPMLDFIHPEDHERSLAAGQSLHEAGEVVGFENRYVCKDGSLKWLEWTVTLAPDDAVYAIARDVSERRDRDTEQASLRRIATLVAKNAAPAEIFAAVSAEVDRVFLRLDPATRDVAGVVRFEPGPELVVVGVSKGIEAVPLGARLPPDELFAPSHVLRTGRSARIRAVDVEAAGTEFADFLRHHGYQSQVASPIVVDGLRWGAVSVNSRNELPPDTEERLERFTELVATAIANTESCAARAVLTEEQAALRRVATLVARDAPPGEVFDAVAMEVGTLLDTDTTVVGRYDDDGAATAIGSWSAAPGGVPVGTRSLLGGRNVLTLVAETERPARIDGYHDASGEAADIARCYGWRSSIAAPILVEGRLWGVMLVATQRPEPFPAGAEERLAAFTDLVSTAVANAQAQDEVRRFGDEQAALGRVATLVAAGAAPERVFTAVVEEVASLLGLERIELVRYNGDATGSVIAASGEHPFPAGSTWSLDDPSVMATVARTRRSARIDDYSTLNGEIARTARDAGFQSAIGAPMNVDGRLWGVIIAISTDPEPIPDRSKARLGQFTELVATAVANAEARHALESVAAEQATLHRIATLVAQGVQPEEVFEAVAEEVAAATVGAVIGVMRFEHDPPAIALVGASKEVDTPIGTRVCIDDALAAAEVFRTGRSARVNRADWSSFGMHIGEAERRLGVGSTVATPIIVGGGLWGTIAVIARDELSPDTEQRLEKFAFLVTTAIANAEGKSELAASRRRIVAASDDARRRIERDLHDGVQQQLVSLGLELGAMKAHPPTGDALTEQLASLTEEVDSVFDALVEIARGIHPAILSQGGLAPALRALARRSAVPVELHAQIDDLLPDEVEVAAHYVVAEALTNAAKHARASVVHLDVTTDGGALMLTVRDDGVGGADPSGGSGLAGLQDRVEALGGTIRIDSSVGSGTSVVVTLPTETGPGQEIERFLHPPKTPVPAAVSLQRGSPLRDTAPPVGTDGQLKAVLAYGADGDR